MSATTCSCCNEPIEQPTTGRPRRFCSDTCSRVAQRNLRRLERHLLALEAEEFDLRAMVRFNPEMRCVMFELPADRLAFVQAEIEALREKVRIQES